jgi:hypothetical protein
VVGFQHWRLLALSLYFLFGLRPCSHLPAQGVHAVKGADKELDAALSGPLLDVQPMFRMRQSSGRRLGSFDNMDFSIVPNWVCVDM